MKKISKVFLKVVSSIILLVSLVMIIVYLRLLFSGDYIIYDSPINGFIRYFFRLILALLFCTMAIIEIFTKLQKYNFINKNINFLELSLFIVSIFILIYGTNYIGILSFGLMFLFYIMKLFVVINMGE